MSELNLKDGETIRDRNLSQLVPGTPIFHGVKGLRFLRCNLTNCIVPEDAEVVDCNTAQVSFCSHLHPEMKGLPQCPEKCEHVIGDAPELVEVDEQEYRQARRGGKALEVQDVKDVDGVLERQVFRVRSWRRADVMEGRR